MTVWIGLIVVLAGVGVLAYFEVRDRGGEGTPVSIAATEAQDAAPAGDAAETDVAEAAADDVGGADEPAVAPEDLVTTLDDIERDGEAAEGVSPDPADGAEETASDVVPSETPDVAQQAGDDAVRPEPEAETDVAALPADETEAVATDQVEGGEAETAVPTPDTADGSAAADADAVTAPDAMDAPNTETAAVDPAAPADDPATVEEPATVEDETIVVVPSFDIVRVEPTGEAVIAGLAAPGSIVELMRGEEPIATAEANERGEWAMALVDPLPPGAHDLGIRTTSPDQTTVQLSDQRIAVMVPESADEEPLVVLATPDAPSTVVQLPEPDEVPVNEPETVIAAVPPEPTLAAPATTPEGGAAPAGVAEVAPSASAETGSTGAGEEAPVVAAENAPAPAPEAGESEMPAPAELAEAPAAEPGVEAETEVALAEQAPAQVGDVPGAAVAEAPAAPTPEVGVATMPSPAPAAPADVVEAEAGQQPERESTDVAVAEPEAGVTEAEPEVEPEIAIAPEPEPEPEPIAPEVVVTAVEAETTGDLYIAGTATTPEPVRVYMDDRLLGEAKPSPSGTWLLQAERDLPAGTYTVRADQVETPSGEVVARAEVPFERDVEVAILKPVVDTGGDATGADVTGRLGDPQTVIIKRRDNLWRISRRIYGKGIRWSTIYQANKDQIRNPRWIYPGQVFVLPEGNTAWEDDPTPETPG
ncbi:LysM peptidoglycan-binding domain-containing protein [Bauldia sp.]|uniref:LysM peptidoglycan-binding domain-containing protein n=1 Tax=Bauldia sp. TaxID=2575872 RepID=UPI003BAA0DD8